MSFSDHSSQNEIEKSPNFLLVSSENALTRYISDQTIFISRHHYFIVLYCIVFYRCQLVMLDVRLHIANTNGEYNVVVAYFLIDN